MGSEVVQGPETNGILETKSLMLSQLPLLIAQKVSVLFLQQDYMWDYFALCHPK